MKTKSEKLKEKFDAQIEILRQIAVDIYYEALEDGYKKAKEENENTTPHQWLPSASDQENYGD